MSTRNKNERKKPKFFQEKRRKNTHKMRTMKGNLTIQIPNQHTLKLWASNIYRERWTTERFLHIQFHPDEMQTFYVSLTFCHFFCYFRNFGFNFDQFVYSTVFVSSLFFFVVGNKNYSIILFRCECGCFAPSTFYLTKTESNGDRDGERRRERERREGKQWEKNIIQSWAQLKSTDNTY